MADDRLSSQRKLTDAEDGLGILAALWRFRLLVVLMTITAGAAGFGASFLQTTMYQSTSTLHLVDPRNSGVFRDESQLTLDPSRYLRNQASFVTSTSVASRAQELLDGDVSAKQIQERVEVEAAVDRDLITISALATTPEGAANLADAVAEAYQQLVAESMRVVTEESVAELSEAEQQLQAQIDSIDAQLERRDDDSALEAERDALVAQLLPLQSRMKQISVDAALYGSGVSLFEQAELPERPTTPQPLRNTAAGSVLGLLVAGAIATWRAQRSRVALRSLDPAPVLRVPLLAEVPDFSAAGVEGGIPAVSAPQSVAGEAYQFIVASLEFRLQETGGKALLITSALPSDGKSTTSLNLAAAAARDGRNILLVDADLRLHGLSRLSHTDGGTGLVDLVDDDVDFAGCSTELRLSDYHRIRMVPAGSTVEEPAGFFRTTDFRNVMQRVRGEADLILVDSPPLLAVSDTSAIASQVDGIVLVISRGTSLALLEDLRARLDFIGTPVIGYVFNRAELRSGGYGQYAYGGESGEGKRRRLGRRVAKAPASSKSLGWTAPLGAGR